jgi:hypothetical protein
VERLDRTQDWWRVSFRVFVFFFDFMFWLTPLYSGDLGFELAFVGVAIVFLPARYLERKYTKR